MKISKIWNFEETLLFRTLRGKIDPGESESDVDSNFQKIENFAKKIESVEKKIGVEPYKCHMLEPSKMRFLRGSVFKKVA